MIRIFRDNIDKDLERLARNKRGKFTMITGKSAYEEVFAASKKIENVNNKIEIYVAKIINNFFGDTITVAGLITGKDIMEQLEKHQVGDYIIIPKNMLRSGDTVFLDDITIEDLEKHYDKKIIVCEYTGEDLIELINKYSKEE